MLRFETSSALGTMAANAVISNAITTLGTTKFRVIAADLYVNMIGHTAGEGPIEVGIFNGDLSDAEMLESLDASPTGPEDIIAKERLRRPVRRACFLSGQATGEVVNDGKPVRVKLNTLLDAGVELELFFVNRDSAAFTTGTILSVMGQIYGYWA